MGGVWNNVDFLIIYSLRDAPLIDEPSHRQLVSFNAIFNMFTFFFFYLLFDSKNGRMFQIHLSSTEQTCVFCTVTIFTHLTSLRKTTTSRGKHNKINRRNITRVPAYAVVEVDCSGRIEIIIIILGNRARTHDD